MFFLFLHHSLQTLETVVRENPWRSAVSKMLKPLCRAATIIPQSMSLKSHLFPILTFGLKHSWSSWSFLHAFSFCHMIGWLKTLLSKKKLSFQFKSANCSYMIWGCFSWSGLSTASQFLNILNDQVIPSMYFFFPDGSGIFQDDNAKINLALVVKEWSTGTNVCQGAWGVIFTQWIGHHLVLTLTPLKVFGMCWKKQNKFH